MMVLQLVDSFLWVFEIQAVVENPLEEDSSLSLYPVLCVKLPSMESTSAL
jgi:hypothetical protein